MAEAEGLATTSDLARARGGRNGLIIALLALCPIRLKNFAALEIGQTFKEVHGKCQPIRHGAARQQLGIDLRCTSKIQIITDQPRPNGCT